MMRLQRYLAHSGVASRRASEALILAGRVRVNGRTVRMLGTSVEDDAKVEVDGRLVEVATTFQYVIANKPVGMMTTLDDPEGRRTISAMIPAGLRLYPVGRLDYDTAGVLLLTNDGRLTHVLTHPRYGVEKTYRAIVRGRLDGPDAERLMEGLRLDDGRTGSALVRIIAARLDRSTIDLTIHEGRNRQVRRMLEEVGHPVLALTRMRFGPIAIGDLGVGMTRPATLKEVAALERIVTEIREQEEHD